MFALFFLGCGGLQLPWWPGRERGDAPDVMQKNRRKHILICHCSKPAQQDFPALVRWALCQPSLQCQGKPWLTVASSEEAQAATRAGISDRSLFVDMLCQGTPGADPAIVASAAVPAPLLAISGFTDLRLHGRGYFGLHELGFRGEGRSLWKV